MTRLPTGLALLAAVLLAGCDVTPSLPEGHGFVKTRSGEDFHELALRLYGDPHRAGELAARCGLGVDDVPPETLILPLGLTTEPPPLYGSLEEPVELGADEAPLYSARRLLGRGDHAGAAALLEEALSREPYRPDLRYLLGLTRSRRGEVRRARVELRAAACLAPTDPRPHLALALLAATLDLKAEARAHGTAAYLLAWPSPDWRAAYLLALLELDDGERRAAETYLQDALTGVPAYGSARERLLELLELARSGAAPLDAAWLSGASPFLDPRHDILAEPQPQEDENDNGAPPVAP